MGDVKLVKFAPLNVTALPTWSALVTVASKFQKKTSVPTTDKLVLVPTEAGKFTE